MIDKSKYLESLKKYLEGNIDRATHMELFKLTAAEHIEEPLGEMIDKDMMGHLDGPDLPADVSAQILKKIVAMEEDTNKLLIHPKRNNRRMYGLSMAAVFLVILFGSAFYYINLRAGAHIAFDGAIPRGYTKKVNNMATPIEFVLEDGSTVKLAPHASLSFPAHFIRDKREVYLTGEAFFTIAKKQDNPFLVYYNNVVTKVLGTSFNIKTNDKTQEVEVSVRTGKVQVSENRYTDSGSIAHKGVILTPNQKAVYNSTHHEFETSLADSIYPLQDAPDKEIKNGRQPTSFFFQKAISLKQLFAQLEAIYGIAIIVDNDNIYNCVFTGDISKQDLLEKLHIVCLTIGATYEVNGTKILVTGRGCN
jgi:transmembrane sensor